MKINQGHNNLQFDLRIYFCRISINTYHYDSVQGNEKNDYKEMIIKKPKNDY